MATMKIPKMVKKAAFDVVSVGSMRVRAMTSPG
jgi:hypothetical protein